METTGAAPDRFIATKAERQVADLLPIDAGPALARATVERVPFWFHTFALNRAEDIYTPGAARDHRYRISTLPDDYSPALTHYLNVATGSPSSSGANYVGRLSIDSAGSVTELDGGGGFVSLEGIEFRAGD